MRQICGFLPWDGERARKDDGFSEQGTITITGSPFTTLRSSRYSTSATRHPFVQRKTALIDRPSENHPAGAGIFEVVMMLEGEAELAGKICQAVTGGGVLRPCTTSTLAVSSQVAFIAGSE